MNWIRAISGLSEENLGFVLVTVLGNRGSSPREEGAKMVVTGERTYDTVGGGNLEFQAISRARELLETGRQTLLREKFVLGKDLGQCCGGTVDLLLECFPSNAFNVILFGAGHVGCSLVKILSGLPCRLTWADSRPELVDQLATQPIVPDIRPVLMDNHDLFVEACPANACYLVMTHSHELDMQLVEGILSRGDSRFLGLIGSRSKAGKFRNRLRRKQFSSAEIDQLTCPVGLPELVGKRPMEVAVSISAQLMQLAEMTRKPEVLQDTCTDRPHGIGGRTVPPCR